VDVSIFNQQGTATHPLVLDIRRRAALLAGQPIGHCESLNLVRYEEGEQHKPHYDYVQEVDVRFAVGRPEPSLDSMFLGGQRFCTVLLYLSSTAEDQGGETAFGELGLKVRPEIGAALIWPNVQKDGQPEPRTVHGSLPLRYGEKLVVNAWLRSEDVDYFRSNLLSDWAYVEKDLRAAFSPALADALLACFSDEVQACLACRRELINFKKLCLHLWQAGSGVEKDLRQLASFFYCEVVSSASEAAEQAAWQLGQESKALQRREQLVVCEQLLAEFKAVQAPGNAGGARLYLRSSSSFRQEFLAQLQGGLDAAFGRRGNGRSVATARPFFLSHVQLDAVWPDVLDVCPGGPGTAAVAKPRSNVALQCSVCLEKQSVVALTPCGTLRPREPLPDVSEARGRPPALNECRGSVAGIWDARNFAKALDAHWAARWPGRAGEEEETAEASNSEEQLGWKTDREMVPSALGPEGLRDLLKAVEVLIARGCSKAVAIRSALQRYCAALRQAVAEAEDLAKQLEALLGGKAECGRVSDAELDGRKGMRPVLAEMLRWLAPMVELRGGDSARSFVSGSRGAAAFVPRGFPDILGKHPRHRNAAAGRGHREAPVQEEELKVKLTRLWLHRGLCLTCEAGLRAQGRCPYGGQRCGSRSIVCEQWSCEKCALLRGDGEDVWQLASQRQPAGASPLEGNHSLDTDLVSVCSSHGRVRIVTRNSRREDIAEFLGRHGVEARVFGDSGAEAASVPSERAVWVRSVKREGLKSKAEVILQELATLQSDDGSQCEDPALKDLVDRGQLLRVLFVRSGARRKKSESEQGLEGRSEGGKALEQIRQVLPELMSDNSEVQALAVPVRLNLAACLQRLGDRSQEVIDLCDEVLQLDPSSVKALFRRATAQQTRAAQLPDDASQRSALQYARQDLVLAAKAEPADRQIRAVLEEVNKKSAGWFSSCSGLYDDRQPEAPPPPPTVCATCGSIGHPACGRSCWITQRAQWLGVSEEEAGNDPADFEE
ncbi:unnamed protein product, partial [Polarella glacialis]